MEPNKTLFTVIKSEQEKIEIILNNVLIMLSNRIYIDKDGNKQQLIDRRESRNDLSDQPAIRDKVKKALVDKGDGIYTIKTNNGENYAIKIIFQKISAIGKQSIINDFFREYGSYRKIIIASDYNNKVADFVNKQHTQIFRESILLEDIITHHDQPKFELLSPKEMKQVKQEYNITDYTANKMLRNEPIARYFALKKGDLIRIIRPSPTAGEAIAYRVVQ